MHEHPIFQAIKDSDIPSIKKWLKKEPDCIHERDEDENTPLLLACWEENEPAIFKLLQCPGIDVNAKDDLDSTPLSFAAGIDNLFLARLLMEMGADVNIRSKSNVTPLMVAASRGDREMVEYFIQHQAEIDHIDEEGDSLYNYVEKGTCSIDMDWLLKNGNFLSEETKNKFRGFRLEKIFE